MKSKAKKPKLMSKEDHFKNLPKNLFSLTSNESLTDIRFYLNFRGKESVRSAHQWILKKLSGLLETLIVQSRTQMPGQVVCITLDNTDPKCFDKLLEYVYTGEINVSKELKRDMESLAKRLGICRIGLDRQVSSESSESESEVGKGSEEDSDEEPPKKISIPNIGKSGTKGQKTIKPRLNNSEIDFSSTSDSGHDMKLKKSKKSAGKKFTPTSSDSEEDPKSKKATKDFESLKEKAMKCNFMLRLEKVEKSKDKEKVKYMKTNTSFGKKQRTSSKVSNPLFQMNSTTAPQKRRMSDNEKKIETKESKKMRQDDCSSSSEVDSEVLEARKNEIPETEIKKKVGIRASSSDSCSDISDKESSKIQCSNESRQTQSGSKTRPPKSEEAVDRKLGPKSKTTKTLPVVKKPAPDKKSSTEKNPGPGKNLDSDKKPTPKRKPGPKSKQVGTNLTELKKGENFKGIFATQGIKICPACSAIFVTEDALKMHFKNCCTQKEEPESAASDASSSEEEVRPDANKIKKKSVQKIKEERKKRTSSVSSESSEDEQQASKAPARKIKKEGTLKVVITSKKPSTNTPRNAQRAASIDENGIQFECHFCPETYDRRSNLKNHVLNHFKEEFYKSLPTKAPFLCPICNQSSRDKVTLMRHYALTHKMIEKYCTKEELQGRVLNGSTPNTKRARSSAKENSKKSVSVPNVLTSSSDCDEGQKDPSKDSERTSKEIKVEKSGNPEYSTKITPPIKFSDESDDDDFTVSSSKASAAIKSFDELLNKEEKGSAREKNNQDSEKNSENNPATNGIPHTAS